MSEPLAPVVFDVAGRFFPMPHGQAEVLAEKLRVFTTGQWSDDVAKINAGDDWIEGARAVADVIEDVLVGRSADPVPLEGKAAEAVRQVLRSSNPDVGRDLLAALGESA